MTGKKLFTNQLFQTLHLLTDGGLGSANAAATAAKGIEVCDRSKRSQGIESRFIIGLICIYHIYSLSGCSCGAAQVKNCVTVKAIPSEVFPRIPARQTA